MYKLIAIDLDGTLLDSYGQISEKNKQTIQRAMEQGIEVVLTSGRNPMSVKNFAFDIQANNYMICGNGALIYDLKQNETIYGQFLDKKKILQLIQICEENSIYYSINTQDSILTKSLNYNVLFYHQENSQKPDNKKTNIHIVQDIYQYVLDRKEEDYIKMNICDDSMIIFKSIMKKIKKVKNIDVLDVGHMSRKIIKTGTEESCIEYYYTEITKENIDKWSAIAYLIDKLNIKPEEVMTIGDNINDQTMLENAGLGIAMANSAPYIQKMADEVTLDNNADGVAVAIEKHILK